MSDGERGWTATHDRTPYENLWALVRHVDIETPTAEIARIAFIRIPGAGDPSTVEAVREAFAEEHAVARARRWLDEQDHLPDITVPERRRTPADAGTVVPRQIVRTAVEYRLGERVPRACAIDDPDSVVACTGPDGPGYKCPECGQQRRREDAILDELLLAVKRERLDESGLSLPASKESSATDHPTETEQSTEIEMLRDTTDDGRTENDGEDADEKTQTQTALSHEDGQSALDGFTVTDGGDTG